MKHLDNTKFDENEKFKNFEYIEDLIFSMVINLSRSYKTFLLVFSSSSKVNTIGIVYIL